MKKKVALLLAFVMVLSLLPMNVFGTGMEYTPATGALVVTVDFADLDAAQAAGLLVDHYLRFTLTEATFTTTPPAVGGGAYAGGDTSVVLYSFQALAALPATAVFNFVVNTDGDVVVDVVGPDQTTRVGPVLLDEEIEPEETPTPPGGDGSIGLTIQPGVVRNPLQEPSRRPEMFEVTMNIDLLHGQLNTFGPASATRLDFRLSGNTSGNDGVRFTNNTFAAGADVANDFPGGGVARLRVSDESQLFWTGTDVRIPEPSRLFSLQPNTPHGTALPADVLNMPGGTMRGELSTAVIGGTNNQRMEAWLAFSSQGLDLMREYTPDTSQSHEIRRISGTLVLEIYFIRAAHNDARINVSRVGRFGMVGDEVLVPLVTNGILAFPSHPHGIDVNGSDPVQFTSALWLPPITITERRPMSFHQRWVPALGGAAAITEQSEAGFTQYIRLMGPAGFVWNVPGAEVPNAAGVSVTRPPGHDAPGAGLQPVTNFYVGVPGQPWTAGAGLHVIPEGMRRGNVANAISTVSVSSAIDGATGRPILQLAVAIPPTARREFPQTEIRAALELRNLVLVPTRDAVDANVYVDVEFGHWQGAAAGAFVMEWTPQFHQDFSQHFLPTGARTDFIQSVLAADRRQSVPPRQGTNTTGIDSINISASVWAALRNPANWNDNEDFRTRFAGQFVGRGDSFEEIIANLVIEDLVIGWTPSNVGQGAGVAAGWHRRGDAWAGRKHVGIRAAASLSMTTTDVPTLISGRRNLPAVNWTHNGDHPSTSNDNNNRFNQHRTARIQIEELVPGAFDTGWGSGVVEIDVGPLEGVRLVHAAWRIWSNQANVGRTTGGVGEGSSWHHVPLLDEDYHPSVALPGVPIVRGNNIRLFVPRDPAITARRTLEVYLFVSVEAGFEHLYDGEPIVIYVDGSAVQTLALDNRSAVVAYVEDPIIVDVVGDIVEISVGQVMSPVEITPIGDIVITETAIGRLTRGTTFTLGVEAYPIPVLGNHALVNSVWVPDDSGLELRTTRVGTGQTAYMRFEVIRESQTAPAVMTFTNNHVMGTFLPGITYGISINGDPTAANPAPANIQNNAIAQNTARGLGGRGNFDSIPYFREIVRFVDFQYEGLPPGVGDHPGGGNWTNQNQNPGVASRLALQLKCWFC